MSKIKARILVAEDDPNLGILITDLLESNSYFAKVCKDGETALQTFRNESFDLCLLDVMMPLKDGFQVADHIRKINAEIPVIFLTARSFKEDKLKGFYLGADDYIIKPFEENELIARIEAVLRRSKKSNESQTEEINIGSYLFNPINQSLTRDGKTKRITERETKILSLLRASKNRIVKRETLLLSVWGENDYFLGRSLDVFITKLRKYLSEDSNITIENIHGVGFMLKDS